MGKMRRHVRCLSEYDQFGLMSRESILPFPSHELQPSLSFHPFSPVSSSSSGFCTAVFFAFSFSSVNIRRYRTHFFTLQFTHTSVSLLVTFIPNSFWQMSEREHCLLFHHDQTAMFLLCKRQLQYL